MVQHDSTTPAEASDPDRPWDVRGRVVMADVDSVVAFTAVLRALDHRRELRAPDPRHHPRRAHRARADPDLDDVGAGCDEVQATRGDESAVAPPMHDPAIVPSFRMTAPSPRRNRR